MRGRGPGPGTLPLLALVVLSGCSNLDVPASSLGSSATTGGGEAVKGADGTALPATRWLPEQSLRGVVLALHGFAEYRGAVYTLGPRLAKAGYALYAYDQRGFGQSAQRGRWLGEAALVAEARAVFRQLRERRPGTPVHLLGQSLGGAVPMLVVSGEGAVAPANRKASSTSSAVWGSGMGRAPYRWPVARRTASAPGACCQGAAHSQRSRP